ncbi:MAG: glycoside hydrolase family 31 protein [Paludibacter sp.]|nr:glycoside hydrolase family 31 protein [Paludibacter sp.]
MKQHLKFLLFLLLIVFNGINSFAQTSFLAEPGVAVFCPANMDSARTLPSLAIIKDLQPEGTVPEDWKNTPVFYNVNGKTAVSISFDSNTDLYGNGEVTGSLRRNNTNITLWNTDNYLYTSVDNGKRLYQSHPWVLGVREDGTAFGIIADNTWKQYFDLSNPITITSEGPAFRVIVIEKENPLEVLKTLGELTGTMKLPPLWALGYQQCKYSYYPDSRVKEIADEFRNRQIPCDVIWLDIDYMQNFKIFTFDSEKFPDPVGLNDYLHNKNFKAIYMIDPGVKKETGYTVYDQGTAGNHWVLDKDGNEFNGNVWPGACAFPDFTRPETQQWWAGLYSGFMAKGVDGVWNDMNEPSVFDGPDGTMPEENIHRGGNNLPQDVHLRYHNVYGMLMVKSSRDGLMAAQPDKRPFILSRSNFLGGQRYAATWTGDNKSTDEYMKMSIPMSLNLSLSGQPFNGPDVGGFEGDSNTELLAEWMAMGAYFPFYRNHNSSNTIDQEPWAFGEKTESVCRTAIGRRYRLMPYLYTLFREASINGTPIMQPAFFADFQDTNLRSEQQIFLMGKDLLIVPRWASNINFPKGDWDKIQFEDSDDGYQSYVLLREGAIVPETSLIQSTEDYKTDSVTLLINPAADGSASGSIYDDAGNGYGYQTGDYEIQSFKSEIYHEDSLKITIKQTEGTRKVSRLYRIGYVTGSSIVYSKWSADTVQYVKIIPDPVTTVDYSLFPSMYIGGAFNNWNPASLPMQYLGNKKWTTSKIYLAAGQQELKFISLKDRTGAEWGNSTGTTGTANVISNDTTGIKFTLSKSGEYIISFNQSTLKYSILEAPKYDYLSIVGDATPTGWDPAGNAMIQDSTNLNIYTYRGRLKSGSMKFHAYNGDWCDGDWLMATVQNQMLSATDYKTFTGCPTDAEDCKWQVDTAGNYEIKIDLDSQKITIKSLEYFPELFLTGDATPGGWDLRYTSDMIVDADNSAVFHWSGELASGEFKIGTTKTWADGWPWIHPKTNAQDLSLTDYEVLDLGIGTDNKWQVGSSEIGTYNITTNLAKREIFITKAISDINNILNPNIRVYPNPVSGYLNIDINEPAYANVTIYSLSGKQVFKERLNDTHTTINTRGLVSADEYLVNVTNRSVSKTFKISNRK